MSTFNKEQLIEHLRSRIEHRKGLIASMHIDRGYRDYLKLELLSSEIALASLEVEPVCVIDQSNLDYLKSGSDADVWPASRTEMGDVLLYRAAPPAPVSVPAAMEMDDDFDSAFEHGKAVGWNACRAAMLQGAEPAKGWIPCSERMPEEIGRYWCYVEEQNCLGKSHYQWNCSWNGDRWWVESENGGRVTHWMPLPNQPKE
ncbi:TPA: DUF551 domain-containing protein [Enterobacter hormaechei]